jgi:hypothetical protein
VVEEDVDGLGAVAGELLVLEGEPREVVVVVGTGDPVEVGEAALGISPPHAVATASMAITAARPGSSTRHLMSLIQPSRP